MVMYLERAEGAWDMKRGLIGWVAIAAFVAAWDRYAEDSLSACFGRGVHHPIKRPLVIAGWAVTSAHLFQFLPARVDPFHLLAKVVIKNVPT